MGGRGEIEGRAHLGGARRLVEAELGRRRARARLAEEDDEAVPLAGGEAAHAVQKHRRVHLSGRWAAGASVRGAQGAARAQRAGPKRTRQAAAQGEAQGEGRCYYAVGGGEGGRAPGQVRPRRGSGRGRC